MLFCPFTFSRARLRLNILLQRGKKGKEREETSFSQSVAGESVVSSRPKPDSSGPS